jgi:hypothetical protein
MRKYIGLITALLPLMVSAQLVITNNYYVVESGGTSVSPTYMVLTNPAPTAITASTGGIISESEFNMVQWNIGTGTGAYTVPFNYLGLYSIPVTCNISTAGVGSGNILFSTYHCATWDNALYEPSDVTSMAEFATTDYSNGFADRFWILDATGYTTKPSPSITFTYLNSGSSASEIASPNFINADSLVAQRFNDNLSEWFDWFGTKATNITSTNTGAVQSGAVAAADFYRSWSLVQDTQMFLRVLPVSTPATLSVFPNPGNGSITISGVTEGQVIELYDAIGQKLGSAVADNNSTMHFDISSKANGVYFVKVQNKDGSLATERKVVKSQ